MGALCLSTCLCISEMCVRLRTSQIMQGLNDNRQQFKCSRQSVRENWVGACVRWEIDSCQRKVLELQSCRYFMHTRISHQGAAWKFPVSNMLFNDGLHLSRIWSQLKGTTSAVLRQLPNNSHTFPQRYVEQLEQRLDSMQRLLKRVRVLSMVLSRIIMTLLIHPRSFCLVLTLRRSYWKSKTAAKCCLMIFRNGRTEMREPESSSQMDVAV